MSQTKTITDISNDIFNLTIPNIQDIEDYFTNPSFNFVFNTANLATDIELLLTNLYNSDRSDILLYTAYKIINLNSGNTTIETTVTNKLYSLYDIQTKSDNKEILISQYTYVLFTFLTTYTEQQTNVNQKIPNENDNTVYSKFKLISVRELLGDIYNDDLHNRFATETSIQEKTYREYLFLLNIQLNLDLSNFDFSNNSMIGYRISNANMRNTNFENADISNCVFSSCDFIGSSFISTNIVETDFRDPVFTNIDLSATNITSVVFTGIDEVFTEDRLPNGFEYNGFLKMIRRDFIPVDKKGLAADAAVAQGISAEAINEINVLSTLNGTISTNLYNKISSVISEVSGEQDIRERRHALLRLLLYKTQGDTITLLFNKDILSMPTVFQKRNVKVFKDDNVINLKNDLMLRRSHGFYSPLENGEYIRIVLRNVDLEILVSRYATVNGKGRYNIVKFSGSAPIKINNITSKDYLAKQYFEDGDVCIVNGLDLFFGGVGEAEASLAMEMFGDPYIYPIYGSPTKMPDVPGIYRMLEGKDLYINSEIGLLSSEKIEKMKDWFFKKAGFHARKLGLITGGYFFTKHWICCDNFSLTIDLQKQIIDVKNKSIDFFKITKMPQVCRETFGYIKGDLYQYYLIECISKEYGKIKIKLKIYHNPQVDNGLSVEIEWGKRDCIGLMMKNYKPNLMQLATLTKKKDPKMRRRLRNAKHKYRVRNLYGKNEIVI